MAHVKALGWASWREASRVAQRASREEKDIEVVRFVFSIVPFGSIVDDGLEEIGLEAVGIM